MKRTRSGKRGRKALSNETHCWDLTSSPSNEQRFFEAVPSLRVAMPQIKAIAKMQKPEAKRLLDAHYPRIQERLITDFQKNRISFTHLCLLTATLADIATEVVEDNFEPEVFVDWLASYGQDIEYELTDFSKSMLSLSKKESPPTTGFNQFMIRRLIERLRALCQLSANTDILTAGDVLEILTTSEDFEGRVFTTDDVVTLVALIIMSRRV